MTACANCKHLQNGLRQEREARGRLQNDLRRLTDALERLARDHAEAIERVARDHAKAMERITRGHNEGTKRQTNAHRAEVMQKLTVVQGQTDNLSVYRDAPVPRRATLTGNAVSVRVFVTDRFI
ncbi:hypothetical protein PF011_g30865 [Phytophthora fragariae]|uniref:Uncharacterized protein n=1 Tax=Phytophthora fragariae TaxID=53985 RepID=A0A6A3GRV2_9STRA|nr:hypothetical protein PF011_g30865 [Phytophthora fragariae]